MGLVASQTELTTAITDLILTLECFGVLIYLHRHNRNTSRDSKWRITIWSWVLGLLSIASFLGAVIHGLTISCFLQEMLWKPLFLILGVLVALFLIGAINDLFGRITARRLIPWAVGLGCVSFVFTEVFSGLFLVFVIYEAAVMVAALLIYLYLSFQRQLHGAGIMALVILANLLAAGIQGSKLSFTLFVTFDHNGIFHLIQMLAVVLLGVGLSGNKCIPVETDG
ncbi:hypothetical protein K8T06_18055 [bacterium]|nr:hypothetical protein [bacterium]